MFFATLRRRGLARVGMALAVASAVAMALMTSPAYGAAATSVGTPRAGETARPDGIVLPPIYRWANVNSGLCLAYDVESRGAARQESCDDGANSDYTIHWILQDTADGNEELINAHNTQCLTIPGSSQANGASPFVYICGGGGAQVFSLVPAAQNPGAYELVNTNSKKCVDVGGAQKNLGAWIVQYDCTGSLDELWRPIS